MVTVIRNYLKIEENMASSGQPDAHQFNEIAQLGFDSVINLAMPSSDYAIANEGELVTSSGMSYIHIPVVWEAPREKQFALFAAVLRQHEGAKVWVHCALNMRVSVFVYLYRCLRLGVPKEEARRSLEAIWTPNKVWSDFIEQIERQGHRSC